MKPRYRGDNGVPGKLLASAKVSNIPLVLDRIRQSGEALDPATARDVLNNRPAAAVAGCPPREAYTEG